MAITLSEDILFVESPFVSSTSGIHGFASIVVEDLIIDALSETLELSWFLRDLHTYVRMYVRLFTCKCHCYLWIMIFDVFVSDSSFKYS